MQVILELCRIIVFYADARIPGGRLSLTETQNGT